MLARDRSSVAEDDGCIILLHVHNITYNNNILSRRKQ